MDVSDSFEVSSDWSTFYKGLKRHYLNETPKNTAMTAECSVQQVLGPMCKEAGVLTKPINW